MVGNKHLGEEVDLRDIWSVLWRGRYFIIIVTFMSFTAGSFYLRNADMKYEVSILLAPTNQEEAQSNLGSLGSLASLAGIALPSSSDSDFMKYQLLLKTRELSAQLFKDKLLIREIFRSEWNHEKQTFFEPQETWKTSTKNYIRKLLTGKTPKQYSSPNPARLSAFIKKRIRISKNKNNNFLTISAESPNPELYQRLIMSMINTTDSLLKKSFMSQSKDAVSFYQEKISKARSKEHREILATLIAKEEKKLLLASREGPFVVEVLTGPNISLQPTSPKITATLLFSIITGIFLSSGILLMRNFLNKNH